MSSLETLRHYASTLIKSQGLEEIAFTPGSDREVSLESAATVALQLIDGWETGVPATEEP